MGFTKITGPETQRGADKVYVDGPSSTFGELKTVSNFPQAQGDFVYGIDAQSFVTSSFQGASVTAADGFCSMTSGTDASGSATVQLRRNLKYRPGQGSLIRSTALFDTPDAGNAQFVGAGSAESGYFIGYFGTNFGILHSEKGQREIRKLTITNGAGTGNVTVTLNGNSIAVPVTGGSDTTQTAYQLSLADYSQVGDGGWLVDVVSSSVYFISARSVAGLNGSYSVAGSGIVGSFTQTKEGEAQTTTFIPSGSFNIDRLDGLGPSGMTLDTSKGNVFGIQFQYLGFGDANFEIENPNTGKFFDFHIIKNANNRTTPVLKNPNVSCLATSANIGGTTTKTLKVASMSSFVEGEPVALDPKFSHSFAISSVATTGTYKPLGIIKTNRVFNGQSCYGELDLLQISLSNVVNNKYYTIGFFRDFIIGGDVNYEYVSETQSVASIATLAPATNTITNLASIKPFYEITIGGDQSKTEDLSKLKFVFGLGRGAVLFAIKGNGSVTGDFIINWFEQQ